MTRPGHSLETRTMAFERLDERLCLSFQTIFDGGVLSLVGTEGRDAASIVAMGDGSVRVVSPGIRGGGTTYNEVQRITVNGLGGNDLIRYLCLDGPAAIAPATFDLGDGDDQLDIRSNLLGASTNGRSINFTIDAGGGDDHVLIGLLLPAVQKVREAAARLNVDLGAGNDQLQLGSHGVDQLDLDISAGEGDDHVLIGLLLPAVQKVREAAARLNVDLGAGNDEFEYGAVGLDQNDLDISAGDGGDRILIGLLLPAVQKVREAAARMNIDLGAGNDQLQLNTQGVARVGLDLSAGEGNDRILIGLLLPAVQKVREAAVRMNVDLGPGADQFRARTIHFDAVDIVFATQDIEDKIDVVQL